MRWWLIFDILAGGLIVGHQLVLATITPSVSRLLSACALRHIVNRQYSTLPLRAALTGKHNTIVRIGPPTGKGPPTASRQKIVVTKCLFYIINVLIWHLDLVSQNTFSVDKGIFIYLFSLLTLHWGPGMVKCVGPTRCLMRPCSLFDYRAFGTLPPRRRRRCGVATVALLYVADDVTIIDAVNSLIV